MSLLKAENFPYRGTFVKSTFAVICHCVMGTARRVDRRVKNVMSDSLSW